MIKLSLGNVGSGKTATAVLHMLQNPDKVYFTNIDVFGKGTKHIHKIKREHIIKKTLVQVKKNGEEVFKLEFNKEFWFEQIKKYKMISVIIDEAHIFFNPRRSMSKLNIIMTDFLALLRRIVGSVDGEKGELILITQLSRRLDVVAKEMATHITYSINHKQVFCTNKKCQHYDVKISTHNENPEQYIYCSYCSKNLTSSKMLIEQVHFKSLENFENWYYYGQKSYFKRISICDIEKIFKNYNTFQWEDIFTDI